MATAGTDSSPASKCRQSTGHILRASAVHWHLHQYWQCRCVAIHKCHRLSPILARRAYQLNQLRESGTDSMSDVSEVAFGGPLSTPAWLRNTTATTKTCSYDRLRHGRVLPTVTTIGTSPYFFRCLGHNCRRHYRTNPAHASDRRFSQGTETKIGAFGKAGKTGWCWCSCCNFPAVIVFPLSSACHSLSLSEGWQLLGRRCDGVTAVAGFYSVGSVGRWGSNDRHFRQPGYGAAGVVVSHQMSPASWIGGGRRDVPERSRSCRKSNFSFCGHWEQFARSNKTAVCMTSRVSPSPNTGINFLKTLRTSGIYAI